MEISLGDNRRVEEMAAATPQLRFVGRAAGRAISLAKN
jgi:hypothetical protein